MSDELIKCDRCGRKISKSSVISGVNYDLFTSCFDKHYTRCDKCNSVIDVNDIYWRKGCKYCSHCYFEEGE